MPGTSTRKVDGGRIPGPANCPAVIEIAMISSLPNGKLCKNIVHGHYTSAPTDMQTLADALFTSLSNAWSSNLGAIMSTDTRFLRVEVRDMTSFTNPVFVGTGTAVPGTGATAVLPPDVAIVLTENVNIRGRGAKGRIYLAGFTDAAGDPQGEIATAAQTAVNAFGTAVAAAISAQNLTPAVAKVARQDYTGLTGTAHPPRPVGWAEVSSYTCRDLNFDSQRRRGQL